MHWGFTYLNIRIYTFGIVSVAVTTDVHVIGPNFR